jgi:hypothetical protein
MAEEEEGAAAEAVVVAKEAGVVAVHHHSNQLELNLVLLENPGNQLIHQIIELLKLLQMPCQ